MAAWRRQHVSQEQFVILASRTHMRSEAIASLLNRRNDLARIFVVAEVDESVDAVGLEQLALLSAGVDGGYSEADRQRVLDCQVAETSTCTGYGDPVAGLSEQAALIRLDLMGKGRAHLGVRALEGAPARHAGAQYSCTRESVRLRLAF